MRPSQIEVTLLPKRAKPRWGFDGVHLVPKSPFTNESASALIRYLGVDDPERAEALRQELEWVAAVFLRSIAQRIVPSESDGPAPYEIGGGRPSSLIDGQKTEVGRLPPKKAYDSWHGRPLTRAERNAALTDLVRAARKFRAALSVGGSIADWIVGDRMAKAAENSRPEALAAFRDGLMKLARRARYERRLLRERHPGTRLHSDDLRKLEERATQLSLILGLGSLDWMSEWDLIDRLPAKAVRPIHTAAELIEFFAEVEQAAQCALAAGKTHSGPEQRSELIQAVGDLVAVWEIETQFQATHTPRGKDGGEGEPHSAAGRFIAAFFKVVEPTLPQTTISSVLAAILKKRHKSQNGRRRGNLPIAKPA
jgi:hypothetical protein